MPANIPVGSTLNRPNSPNSGFFNRPPQNSFGVGQRAINATGAVVSNVVNNAVNSAIATSPTASALYNVARVGINAFNQKKPGKGKDIGSMILRAIKGTTSEVKKSGLETKGTFERVGKDLGGSLKELQGRMEELNRRMTKRGAEGRGVPSGSRIQMRTVAGEFSDKDETAEKSLLELQQIKKLLEEGNKTDEQKFEEGKNRGQSADLNNTTTEAKTEEGGGFFDKIKGFFSSLFSGLSKTLSGFLGVFKNLPSLVSILTKISPFLAVLGAAWAGFKIGEWLNKTFDLSMKINDLIDVIKNWTPFGNNKNLQEKSDDAIARAARDKEARRIQGRSTDLEKVEYAEQLKKEEDKKRWKIETDEKKLKEINETRIRSGMEALKTLPEIDDVEDRAAREARWPDMAKTNIEAPKPVAVIDKEEMFPKLDSSARELTSAQSTLKEAETMKKNYVEKEQPNLTVNNVNNTTNQPIVMPLDPRDNNSTIQRLQDASFEYRMNR